MMPLHRARVTCPRERSEEEIPVTEASWSGRCLSPSTVGVMVRQVSLCWAPAWIMLEYTMDSSTSRPARDREGLCVNSGTLSLQAIEFPGGQEWVDLLPLPSVGGCFLARTHTVWVAVLSPRPQPVLSLPTPTLPSGGDFVCCVSPNRPAAVGCWVPSGPNAYTDQYHHSCY